MDFCTEHEKRELLYNTVLCQLFFNSNEREQMDLFLGRIRKIEEMFPRDEVPETTWDDLYAEIAKITGAPYNSKKAKSADTKPKKKRTTYDCFLWPIVASEARTQVAGVLASLPEKLRNALVDLSGKSEGNAYRYIVLFWASVFVENGGKQIGDTLLEKYGENFADKELQRLLISFFGWDSSEYSEEVWMDACRLTRLALLENCSVWSEEGCSVSDAFELIPSKQVQANILLDVSSEEVANILVPSLIAYWNNESDIDLKNKVQNQLLKLAQSGNISTDVAKQVFNFIYPDGISKNNVDTFMDAAENEKAVQNFGMYISSLCEE